MHVPYDTLKHNTVICFCTDPGRQDLSDSHDEPHINDAGVFKYLGARLDTGLNFECESTNQEIEYEDSVLYNTKQCLCKIEHPCSINYQ